MARPEPLLPPDLDIHRYIRELSSGLRGRAIEALGPDNWESYDAAWQKWAHEGQLAPLTTASGNPWSTWVINVVMLVMSSTRLFRTPSQT